MSSSAQFLRSAKLLLTNANTNLDLSNLRFRFTVDAADIETPNTAVIRVYNLSDQTLKNAISEYNGVIIQAGYGDNSAQIFNGVVKQFRRGKERNVDSFLDIYAADGDMEYNFSPVNATLKGGSTSKQQFDTLTSALGLPSDPAAPSYLSQTGGILPRGKVLFGLARDQMRSLANANQVRWSIQNGVVTLVPLTGYLPGEAVEINSATGMIGIPEATDQGIRVQCLLNPKIRVGGQIQINNRDITSTTIKQQFFPRYTDYNLIATVNSATDGTYRVIVVSHQGDTRDVEWYTNLVCLNIAPGVQASESVLPYGIPA